MLFGPSTVSRVGVGGDCRGWGGGGYKKCLKDAPRAPRSTWDTCRPAPCFGVDQEGGCHALWGACAPLETGMPQRRGQCIGPDPLPRLAPMRPRLLCSRTCSPSPAAHSTADGDAGPRRSSLRAGPRARAKAGACDRPTSPANPRLTAQSMRGTAQHPEMEVGQTGRLQWNCRANGSVPQSLSQSYDWRRPHTYTHQNTGRGRPHSCTHHNPNAAPKRSHTRARARAHKLRAARQEKRNKSGWETLLGSCGQPQTSSGSMKLGGVHRVAGARKCIPTPSGPPQTQIIPGGARAHLRTIDP